MGTNSPEYMKRYRATKRAEFKAGLVQPEHGTNHTYTLFGCRCDACKAARASWQAGHPRDVAKEYARTNEYRKQVSKDQAPRHGKRWEQEELRVAVAQNPDGTYVHSVVDAATKLGRTVQGVNWARNQHRKLPGKPRMHDA